MTPQIPSARRAERLAGRVKSQRPPAVSSAKLAEVLRISQDEYMWLLPFDQILVRAVQSMLEGIPTTSVERVSTKQVDTLVLHDGDRTLSLDLRPLKTAEGKSGVRQTIQAYESTQRFLLVAPGQSARNLENAAIAGLLAEIGPGVRLVADEHRGTSSGVRPTPASSAGASAIREAVFDGDIQYVKLAVFDEQSTKRIRSWMNRGSDKEVYLLDLRDNPGESLDDAIAAATSLIPKGQLITEVIARSTGDRMEYRSSADGSPRSILTVLVNERTAGSAEMVACAIRDAGVGVLVGVRTAGIDEFYTRHPLPDGSVLRVSSGRFYCPNGRNIRWEGQEVDVEVANTSAEAVTLGDFRSGSVAPNLALSGDGQLRTAVAVARCLRGNGGMRLEALGDTRAGVLTALLGQCQQNRF